MQVYGVYRTKGAVTAPAIEFKSGVKARTEDTISKVISVVLHSPYYKFGVGCSNFKIGRADGEREGFHTDGQECPSYEASLLLRLHLTLERVAPFTYDELGNIVFQGVW